MALRKFLFQNQVEGFSEEQSAFDSLDLQGGRIENLGAPINPNDAATRAYVDSVATGLDVKQSVRTKTTADLSTWAPAGAGETKTLTSPAASLAFNTIGGVAVAVGDRVLVTTAGGSDTTPSPHNGIYVVSQLADAASDALVLTRAYDADADAEVTGGMFTFVTEGTAHDKGFVLVTDDPITLETTALQFSQFSSTVLYTFDAGLTETAGSIKVDLDTLADGQGIGADGGSSGLEFDQAGAGGKLRARVSPAGGVQRAADGLAAKLDPQANASGANASLASSSLGLKVQRAPKVEENYQAHEAIGAGEPVTWAAGVTRKLAKAMAGVDAKARIVGIARTAGQADEQIAVVTSGIATNVLWGATPGQPYYLQDDGGIGPFASLPQGARVMRLGFAVSASDLFIDIADLGKRSNDAGSAAPGGGGTPRPAVVESDGVTISGDGSAADPLAVIFAGLDEKVKVKTDGVTITGDGTTAHPLVATASAPTVDGTTITGAGTPASPFKATAPVADQVTIKGAGTAASPFRATAPVADQLTITGAGTAAEPFAIVPTSLDGQISVITDGDTITGSGTAADPLVVVLPAGVGAPHTDGMTLTGDGSEADPLTVQPEGLHERVRVSVLSDLLTGDGTASSPLILDLEVDGITIAGRGTPVNPLRAIIPEATVSSDASIDGTGAAASPLSVNVASLHDRVRVAVDTTTITGDGTLASPLSAIIPSDYPVATDSTLTGDGTEQAPLAVNAPALAGQVAVLTDESLTGSGVEGDPLAVVFPPLSVHTDGTSITGSGTEEDPLTVSAVPTLVVTDASLSGDGSVASPLAVVVAQLDERVKVASDASISGDGTSASPLAVVPAQLDEKIKVASDATIDGDGTTASPLAVVPSQLDEKVRVATDATISGDGTTAHPLAVDTAALAGEIAVEVDGTTITGDGTDSSPLTVSFAGLAGNVAVSVGTTLSGDGTSGSPLDVNAASLSGFVAVTTDATLSGDGTSASPLSVAAPGLTSVSATGALTGSGTPADPLSSPGTQTLVFRPDSDLSGPVVFSTWAGLYARLEQLRDAANGSGSYVIAFDGECPIPTKVAGSEPPIPYDMTGVSWESYADGAKVTLQEGATFEHGPHKFSELQIISETTAVSPWTLTAVSADPQVSPQFPQLHFDDVWLERSGTGSKPLFATGSSGYGYVYLRNSSVYSPDAEAPVFEALFTGSSLELYLDFEAYLNANTVRGEVSATAYDDASEVEPIQIGFSDEFYAYRPDMLPRIRVTEASSYLDVSELQLVSDSSTAIDVRASMYPDHQLIVKAVGDTALTITSTYGDTIDGMASLSIPKGASVVLTSEGSSNNWISLVSNPSGGGMQLDVRPGTDTSSSPPPVAIGELVRIESGYADHIDLPLTAADNKGTFVAVRNASEAGLVRVRAAYDENDAQDKIEGLYDDAPVEPGETLLLVSEGLVDGLARGNWVPLRVPGRQQTVLASAEFHIELASEVLTPILDKKLLFGTEAFGTFSRVDTGVYRSSVSLAPLRLPEGISLLVQVSLSHPASSGALLAFGRYDASNGYIEVQTRDLSGAVDLVTGDQRLSVSVLAVALAL